MLGFLFIAAAAPFRHREDPNLEQLRKRRQQAWNAYLAAKETLGKLNPATGLALRRVVDLDGEYLNAQLGRTP